MDVRGFAENMGNIIRRTLDVSEWPIGDRLLAKDGFAQAGIRSCDPVKAMPGKANALVPTSLQSFSFLTINI
jgi:hypothetical protein